MELLFKGIDEPSELGHREMDGQVREGSGRDERERISQYAATYQKINFHYVVSTLYEWSEMGIRDIDGQVREGSGRTERERMSQYRARAYNPQLGRFMSEDPKLFDAGDYNLFRYCHNDPIDFTDPMGLEDQNHTGLAPRELSRTLADEQYGKDMAAIQWAMSDLMHNASGGIAIGMTGYNYEQANGGLQVAQTKNASSSRLDKASGTKEAVQAEKNAMISEANRWNETSPGGSFHNDCTQQAVNLQLDLLHKVQPFYWDPRVVGGSAPFFSTQVWTMHHHAVLVDPRPIASDLGFKAFMLDSWKNLWRTYVTHDSAVRVYSPQRFRERYPYPIPNEEYP